MFHMEHDPEEAQEEQPINAVPLFVNIPAPIRTDADLERALVQDQAA